MIIPHTLKVKKNLIDCYIAAIAEENDCAVFTLDEHSREIGKVLLLQLL